MSDSKTVATKNLFDFADILERLGIPFFLEGGTLLGAYRDGDFCLGDENDIDLGSYAKYQDRIPEIIEAAKKEGFKLYHHWTGDPRAPGKAQEIAIVRGTCLIPELSVEKQMKIDLFFYEEKEDKAWTCVYKKNRCTPRVVPLASIRDLGIIAFKGRPFNRPGNIEAYLEHTYGDWKTPIHRRDYSCYNPDQLKALQPDFKFYEKGDSDF
ncbi:hypothetical protein DRQ25_00895 [Candidatus Fermentibacteria bacterium]|nr:MAG: hypothetical protein DRQ25_00895 [Candidatus Fermentibacteria bacterium]